MGKGDIASYEQFLLFPQCFQKACFPGASKGVIVWEWVKNKLSDQLRVFAHGQSECLSVISKPDRTHLELLINKNTSSHIQMQHTRTVLIQPAIFSEVKSKKEYGVQNSGATENPFTLYQTML